jgi:hypothetical protein
MVWHNVYDYFYLAIIHRLLCLKTTCFGIGFYFRLQVTEKEEIPILLVSSIELVSTLENMAKFKYLGAVIKK